MRASGTFIGIRSKSKFQHFTIFTFIDTPSHAEVMAGCERVGCGFICSSGKVFQSVSMGGKSVVRSRNMIQSFYPQSQPGDHHDHLQSLRMLDERKNSLNHLGSSSAMLICHTPVPSSSSSPLTNTKTLQLTNNRTRGGPTGRSPAFSSTPHQMYVSSRAISTTLISPRQNTSFFFSKNHIGFVAVPHQMAYVIERFGRFHRVLPSGLHLLVPFVDRVAYIHSLKEEALPIPNQTAITRDNVTLQIDGVLYVRIEDAYKASYGVENPIFAVTQLAQTTMRSELGKLTLDNTFLERNALNRAIVEAINTAAGPWGLTCLRYEIRDILLPTNIRNAMERQAEAERLKRAEVLRSEGERARLINLAMGQKEATILNAEGQAEGVRQRAAAAAESVRKIAETTSIQGGMQALSLQLAENYVSAFGRLAEKSNTIIVPADAADTAKMLGQALGVFRAVDTSMARAPPSPTPEAIVHENSKTVAG